jgi:hypothetical protein
MRSSHPEYATATAWCAVSPSRCAFCDAGHSVTRGLVALAAIRHRAWGVGSVGVTSAGVLGAPLMRVQPVSARHAADDPSPRTARHPTLSMLHGGIIAGMRFAGWGIGAWAGLLGACSLLALDGLTGGVGSGGDASSDGTGVPVDGAAEGSSGGGGSDASDSAAPGDGPSASDTSVAGDSAAPDAAMLPPYRVVFVTSVLYSGSLGGVPGADSKCQARANAVPLPGTFLAWISDGMVTPAGRMPHENLPYVLVDGQTQVAANWNQLVSGTLSHAIDTTELGTRMMAVPSCGPQGFLGNFVWTDTTSTGSLWNAGDLCTDWTSGNNGATASMGNATSTTYWTAWCTGVPCDTQAPLYCFQQ